MNTRTNRGSVISLKYKKIDLGTESSKNAVLDEGKYRKLVLEIERINKVNQQLVQDNNMYASDLEEAEDELHEAKDQIAKLIEELNNLTKLNEALTHSKSKVIQQLHGFENNESSLLNQFSTFRLKSSSSNLGIHSNSDDESQIQSSKSNSLIQSVS